MEQHIRELIEQGGDLNQLVDGDTLLGMAAVEGDIGSAHLLLEHGADPDAGLFPPLALCSDASIARLLLEYGADPNAPTPHGWTPLFHTYDVGVADVLIQYGAQVNWMDARGCTPLWYIMNWGGVRIADLLLAHGADPTIQYQGRIALEHPFVQNWYRQRAETEEGLRALEHTYPKDVLNTVFEMLY